MKSKKAIKAQVEPVVRRKYAELGNVGYPEMQGIRLRYDNGMGQWIGPDLFKEHPEIVVKYINDWLNHKSV